MITTFDNKKWDRETILAEMLNDDFYYGYLGKNALSASSLKTLIKSPKTFHYVRKYGSGETQALRDGRLFHTMVLEPHKIEDMVFIDGTKATKLYKEAVAEHKRDVYTMSEKNEAERLADALLKNHEAMGLISKSEFEVPAIEMIDGLPFRAKADILKPNMIVDLKTTTDIGSFKYSAYKYGYDLQAYLYSLMFNVDEFVFLVIDKGSTDIGIFECSEEFLESGKQKLQQGIDNYEYFFQSEGIDLHDYVIKGIL
jgi:hypothetical protein